MEKHRDTHTRYNPDIYTLDYLPRVRTKDLQPLFRAARHFAELVNGTWTDTTTPTFNDLWTYYTHATLSVGGVEYTIAAVHNNSRNDLHIDALVFTWNFKGAPRQQRVRVVWRPSHLVPTSSYVYFATEDGALFRTMYQTPDGELLPRPLAKHGRYEIQRLSKRNKLVRAVFHAQPPESKHAHWQYKGRWTPHARRFFRWAVAFDEAMADPMFAPYRHNLKRRKRGLLCRDILQTMHTSPNV